MYINVPKKRYPPINRYTGPVLNYIGMFKEYKGEAYFFYYYEYYDVKCGIVDRDSIKFKMSFFDTLRYDIPERIKTYFYLKYINTKWIEKNKDKIVQCNEHNYHDNYIGQIKETIYFSTYENDKLYFQSVDIECFSICGVKNVNTIKILSFDVYETYRVKDVICVGEKVKEEKLIKTMKEYFEWYVREPLVFDEHQIHEGEYDDEIN